MFLLASLVLGVFLGVCTLVGQAILPDALLQLANSGAVWVIVAFLLGRIARGMSLAILAGFLALVGEIIGYYLPAWFWTGAFSPSAYAVIGFWFVVALIAGPLLGAAGYISKNGSGVLQIIATAMLGAVFIGEGLYYIFVLQYIATGLVWCALALFITLLVSRSSQRFQSLFATIAIGLIFFGGELFLLWLDSMRAQLFQG